MKARHLLRHSEASVTDIAYRCGFSDSNHFSTLFAESLTGHRVIFVRDGMAFCNNANLLNVFVRHIANNQLRSLTEVATVAHQLKLLKDDFCQRPAGSRCG